MGGWGEAGREAKEPEAFIDDSIIHAGGFRFGLGRKTGEKGPCEGGVKLE